MERDPFEEYIRQTEPDVRKKGYAWDTAIGLQAVDGLKPSQYLIDTAIQNIEGTVTFNKAQELIDNYYTEKRDSSPNNRTEEADKVSLRIAQILSEDAFTFSASEYLAIHKTLFIGIYDHAGKMRDYNITKKEWVLDEATVIYGNASRLKENLDYDISQEREFSYKGLNNDQLVHHLAGFVSKLWQNHVFCEGNTRTTAVFLIQYLKKLGFDVTNDLFAKNAWYFRNTLVRANYSNVKDGIYETTEYLELFLKNLMFNEQNELSNRYMHIHAEQNSQDKNIINEERE